MIRSLDECGEEIKFTVQDHWDQWNFNIEVVLSSTVQGDLVPVRMLATEVLLYSPELLRLYGTRLLGSTPVGSG